VNEIRLLQGMLLMLFAILITLGGGFAIGLVLGLVALLVGLLMVPPAPRK
jgi:hypothetical protein